MLHRSGGWLLQRPISGSRCRDAMGCYPLTTCDDWEGIFDDLRDLSECLVAVCLIADPFSDIGAGDLRQFFKDVCFPFKEHMVVDLSRPMNKTISKHHQRYAKKCLKNVKVCIAEEPESSLDTWTKLYGNLIRRHDIQGLTRFSAKAFSYQLKVPGCVVFKAVHKTRVVAMHIWYRYPDRAYYHLGASSDEGYALHASFGLMWKAIEYFGQKGLRWLNLGGGAGTKADTNDGLTRFKRGWASDVRSAYFCGTIMDAQQYDVLCRSHQHAIGSYFPAYRTGEFL